MFGKTIFALFVIAAASAAVISCGCGESGIGDSGISADGNAATAYQDGTNAKSNVIKISGKAQNAGIGIDGVKVSAGTLKTTTGNNGYFALNVPVSSNSKRVAVFFEKDGYSSNVKVIYSVKAGKAYSIKVNMKSADVYKKINPAVSNTVSLNDNGNNLIAQVKIPAYSLIDPSGQPVTGSVNIGLTYGDPTKQDGKNIFPGDYMSVESAGSDIETPIESIVFADITIKDENGKRIYWIDHANPCSITLRLPESLQKAFNTGDSIAWWSLNENTGVWLREDAAPLTSSADDARVIDVGGIKYAQADVMHFSSWNCDQTYTRAYFKVRVLDEKGKPVQDCIVRADGVSYEAVTTAVTDTEGYAEIFVKGSDSAVTETAKLFAEIAHAKFYYDITHFSEGEVEENELNTPPMQKTAVLSNIIRVPEMGQINVTVLDMDLKPVSGVDVYSTADQVVTTDEKGKASFNGPENIAVQIFIPRSDISVNETTVTNAGVPENVTLLYVPPYDEE
ncbi:MAG: hypothetical protein HZA48_12400 [Planctomycetes bacterium]|nr:hypothetical protein [Planctomycetota bacterium]